MQHSRGRHMNVSNMQEPTEPEVVRIRIAEIPEGGAVGARVMSSTGGFDVILVRIGDRVLGYHNECPHAGRRLDYAPGRFIIDKGHLVCAAHGAMFRIDGGACTSGPCLGSALAKISLRIEDGDVVLSQ